MDRDTNWARTEKAYRLMTLGEGEAFDDPIKAIEGCYKEYPDLSDYYLPGMILDKSGLVKNDDAVIFFNYRTDRTRQITTAFTDPAFKEFKRTVSRVKFICMGAVFRDSPCRFQRAESRKQSC